MRTALLAVAAVAAGALVVPATIAAAGADPTSAAGTRYSDPRYDAAATVSVSGTLTPIHTETGREQYGVALADGSFVPVSLARLGDELTRPRPFSGDLAVPAAVETRAESRGATIDPGDDIDGTTGEGRVVLAAAATATSPLPVASATLGTAPAATAQAVTAAPHRLYVAVITNRGTLETDTSIATKTAAMRSYWQTESDGLISTFTQPSATVSYASSAAPATSAGCGLADPSGVWSEAGQQFPGVNFNTGGNHLMVIVPDACGDAGAAGIGTVGSSLASGGRTIVTLGGTAVAIGVHELGHNLSLQHANAEQCTTSCSTNEYWDLYSIMGLAVGGGSWTPASLDTAYRLQTGIAGSGEVTALTSSATVRLAGRGTSSGVRGLTVTDPASGAKYVIEYRSGAGRDATAFYASPRTLNNYVYRPGVVVERVESDRETTMITRASNGKYLTSLLAGESLTAGQVTVVVGTASAASGADVTVTLPGSSAPTSTPPTSTPPTSTPPTSTPPTTASFVPGTPVVYGTARVGRQLAVAPGLWSPAPTYFTAQWLANGLAIPRANGARLTLTRALLGARISVRVTAYRTGYTPLARTSAATAPVAAGLISTRTVTITGRAKVGRTLVATTGTWSPRPALSYRWYANGRALKATARTLKVTPALRGTRLTVRLTARMDGYLPASRISPRTSSVR